MMGNSSGSPLATRSGKKILSRGHRGTEGEWGMGNGVVDC